MANQLDVQLLRDKTYRAEGRLMAEGMKLGMVKLEKVELEIVKLEMMKLGMMNLGMVKLEMVELRMMKLEMMKLVMMKLVMMKLGMKGDDGEKEIEEGNAEYLSRGAPPAPNPHSAFSHIGSPHMQSAKKEQLQV